MMGALALRKPVGTPFSQKLASDALESASYTQVSAALPYAASAIQVSNTSAEAVILATGGAGSEVALPFIVPPGAHLIVPIELKKGVRLAAKAKDADAATGFLVINFLQ